MPRPAEPRGYCREERAPEGVRGAGEVDLEVLGSSAAAERGLAELQATAAPPAVRGASTASQDCKPSAGGC